VAPFLNEFRYLNFSVFPEYLTSLALLRSLLCHAMYGSPVSVGVVFVETPYLESFAVLAFTEILSEVCSSPIFNSSAVTF
jgi:hypothetical protein